MAADDRLNDVPSDLLSELEPGDVEFHTLARLLRDAHRRVRVLAVPDEERIRLARRLLAICDAAKRDVRAALMRIEGFLADLERSFDTPGSRKIPMGD